MMIYAAEWDVLSANCRSGWKEGGELQRVWDAGLETARFRYGLVR